MIKVFTLNKNKKIELTEKELKTLLDEAYWEGYNAKNTYIYSSPGSTPVSPYYYTTISSNGTITLNTSDITTSNATSN